MFKILSTKVRLEVQVKLVDRNTYNSLKKTVCQLETFNSVTIGDIYTGNVYQEHLNNGRLGKLHQLSYCMATDGVR